MISKIVRATSKECGDLESWYSWTGVQFSSATEPASLQSDSRMQKLRVCYTHRVLDCAETVRHHNMQPHTNNLHHINISVLCPCPVSSWAGDKVVVRYKTGIRGFNPCACRYTQTTSLPPICSPICSFPQPSWTVTQVALMPANMYRNLLLNPQLTLQCTDCSYAHL